MQAQTRIRRWPWVAIGLSLAVAFTFSMISPADSVQGDLVRIMYVHVPAAWLAYLAFFVTFVGSVGYLLARNLRWDRIAAASAEIGVYFTGLAIALGMIWAKPTWGVWWTWDARLTLTAIMFFVYLGYLALRRTTDDPVVRAVRSSVLGVLGAIQIPLVHFSVLWWRTLHQPPSLIRPDGPAIQDPLMLAALLIGVLAFTIVYASLMVKRIELIHLEDQRAAVEQSIERPVAGEAVTAPELGASP
ncbi:MAG: cytochrome c biogenesis protein CcsA [Actinomycetota bacterium]|nr:cytochrome c biogenesis protein CcsA [Actinomycetota bacterium]